MPPYKPEKHTDTVRTLAATIERAGLRVPISMALDALRPLDFLSSQAALFVHPFTRGSSWEHYTAVLTNEQSWAHLRQLLNREDNQSADSRKQPPRNEQAE